jgi:hypothetical protein
MAADATMKMVLQEAMLLIHDADGHVQPTIGSLVVEDGCIARIELGPNVDFGEESFDRIIDCRGKIVSPGFISTHHHLWQTQLKGMYGNHTLIEYLPTGLVGGALYSPEDAFWGELGGAMEAIDAGTTTVVDHSHLNPGSDYRKFVPFFLSLFLSFFLPFLSLFFFSPFLFLSRLHTREVTNISAHQKPKLPSKPFSLRASAQYTVTYPNAP